MNVARLAEVAMYLIRDHLQATLPQKLTETQDQRVGYGNYQVTLPPPKEYALSELRKLLKLPMVFLLADRIDFQLDRGQNHPNALLFMNVTCVVEDRNSDLLTIQAYRYQSALYSVLSGAQLTDTSGDMKLVIKVMQANYSPVYTPDEPGSASNVFRKEVSLALEINHWENLGS